MIRHSFRRAGAAVAVAAALLFVAPSAATQCFGPDNLDVGPCCGSTLPNLPFFPNANLTSLGICWDGCAVAGTDDLFVQWSPPTQTVCTEYISQLTVTDATGLPVLSGLLTLDYTRTWYEEDPNTGAPTQIWRFVAKADLSGVPGTTPSSCVLPSCIAPVGPHSTAFYYGYVDYEQCAAGTGSQSIVLYHSCDRYIHQPGFSDRPGVFHPTRSYAIVAPHSTLQPFVPMNMKAPSGPVFAEATRNIDQTPGVFNCFVEDRVAGGDMLALGVGCFCTLSTTPKQQTARRFSGQTSCINAVGLPGAWASLNISFPAIPWLHMISTSIGSWTNGNVYPGKEFAWVDEGLFVRQDACTGDFVELKYGATTDEGWVVIPTTPVASQTFTDLADNYTAPLAGPYPTPILGSVRPTDHLIYVNTP